MNSRRALVIVVIVATLIQPSVPASGQTAVPMSFTAPAEFERQEYIWLSWVERGWLGGPLFSDVTVNLMRIITPHAKVRLMFSSLTVDDQSYSGPHRLPQSAAQSGASASSAKALTSLGWNSYTTLSPVGQFQDPGPYFLRSADGKLAIADYSYDHPLPAVEALDRDIAARLGLPTIRSPIVSEGGGRQVNGRGTLLLVESVELARNPDMTRDEIEREHKRVLGVTNVIWLKQGPADEEWGKLRDCRWGHWHRRTRGRVRSLCRCPHNPPREGR